MINKSERGKKTRFIEEIEYSRPIAITSLLWLSVPFLFWTISNLTSLNLFVDRYFIPKESALILLIACGSSLIFRNLPKNKSMKIPIWTIFGVSLVLILISTKRAAFGLNKATNYHHSLIIDKPYSSSVKPIVFEDDPSYFPNAYLGNNECLFAVNNDSLIKVYKRFSSKIKILKK